MRRLLYHWQLFLGVLFFIIFAVDIEYDRDVWTWLWLLNSMLNIVGHSVRVVRDEIKRNRDQNPWIGLR